MNSLSPVSFGNSLAAIDSAKAGQAEAALKIKAKAKGAAQDFEATFLGNMFQEMSTGIDGDGPFGGSGSLKVWRSFMTEQFAKSFAKAGGIGIAAKVYDELLKQQGLNAS